MKRLTIVLLSMVVAVTLSSRIFGQGKPNQAPPPPPSPFIESPVPDGKTLIYIYWNAGWSEKNHGFMIFAKSGPIGVLSPNSYVTYVTEPGTISLWLVGAFSKSLKVEAVAGQISYV